jgi:predicted CopG family antitoxin
MYIKKEDFSYFETLYKTLDEAKQKKFMDIIVKAAGKRTGEDISKIKVIGDEIFDVQGIDPGEIVTRTMIKKAYKEAKGG